MSVGVSIIVPDEEEKMNPWQLWEMDEVLCDVPDVTPLLACWERKTHPAQLAMREYLCYLEQAFQPWLNSDRPLALLMEIDVKESSLLSHHFDLENYLTPI